MGRITIPLYYCKSKVPLVIFGTSGLKNRGKKWIGIIDTGSEVSMFDWSLLDNGFKSNDAPGETKFIGVNGEGSATKVSVVSGDVVFLAKDSKEYTLPVIGATYDFSALKETFCQRTKKNVDITAIFGSDFLKEHEARIDYRNKRITFNI